MEMDTLRRVCGISIRDRIRNEVINEKKKIRERVDEEIQRRYLISYGHVKRMVENRIPRMAKQYKSTCKKKREDQEEHGLLK